MACASAGLRAIDGEVMSRSGLTPVAKPPGDRTLHTVPVACTVMGFVLER